MAFCTNCGWQGASKSCRADRCRADAGGEPRPLCWPCFNEGRGVCAWCELAAREDAAESAAGPLPPGPAPAPPAPEPGGFLPPRDWRPDTDGDHLE